MDLRDLEFGPPSRHELALRILHAPIEIAGQAALSVHGLRELGVRARSFAAVHPFQYVHAPDLLPAPGRRAMLAAATRAVSGSDVLHFHFGESFVRAALDARLARALGKRIVVEFHGSDVRMPSRERARNPYYTPLVGEDDAKATRLLRRWSRLARGHAILCDHGLMEVVAPWFEHVHVVGHRVDVRALAPVLPRGDATDRPTVVVHAPSDLTAKGTRFVRAAVEALRVRGVALEYVEVMGLGQQAAQAIYRRADLVVDQLCFGTHGVFAAEAMALGKPVVCFILDDLVGTFPPDFPIVNASPSTIEEVLARWTRRGAAPERAQLGDRSRRYAERVHDHRAVARRLLHVYGQLG